MFRLFAKTVSVEFIDGATNKRIATSEVPLEQLPDTFVLDTELDMAGAHYVVVQAHPKTKREFAKTKSLTVTLRRVESIDPKKILFSLPTICGAALPANTSDGKSDDVLVLHEDDWRQCEFVATDQRAAISAELSSIRQILAVAAAGVGWREIHVRERISRPLPTGITWPNVAACLGEYESLAGVAFRTRENPVLHTVAARLPDKVILWGVEEVGELNVLCVENLETASNATKVALKCVADSLSLVLLNWCKCQAYSPGVAFADAVGTPWDGIA